MKFLRFGFVRILGVSALALLASAPSNAAFTEQGATLFGGLNLAARSVSLADFDNDGDLDVFFQGPGTSRTTSNRQILRNNFSETGTLSFTNVTSAMMPNGVGDSWSGGWADYNGDGYVDLFVGSRNAGDDVGVVLRNEGGLAFSNQTNSTGLTDPGWHQNVGWADINNDQLLDLIIGQEGPERHQIYLQGAGFQFTAVGAQVGFQQSFGTHSYGLAIGDVDGDGDLDIYISTCQAGGNIRNNFYKNMLAETGTLSFVDVADTNGTQFMANSYGTEFVDFNNDGHLDLYMAGADGSETKLWLNDGTGNFTDVKSITGHELLRDSNGNPVRGFDFNGAKAIDFDNDGDLDLYFHDNLNTSVGNTRLFRNDGNWNFVDVTAEMGLRFAAGGVHVGAGGFDSVWGDLDRDGDLDLIVPNNSTLSGVATPERVFINDASTNGNHWLYVELEGPSWNTTGLGSSLYATMNEGTEDELTLRREANTNIGTFNQSDLPVHFGMGAATEVDRLLIRWPDGTEQVIYNVDANQYLTVSYNPTTPGDFNNDGSVDTADYILWRKGYGTLYNDAAYADWSANFGWTSTTEGSGSNANVPEPGVVAMLLIATTWAAGSRRSPRVRR